jgi:2'-5' RNA ligase
MPFAIQLFFDKKIELAIQATWHKMADSNVAPFLGTSGNRPHISLALCEELDKVTCQAKLETWAAGVKPLPVSFQQLGLFPAPGAVLFTGPVVTRELLALQREVDELLDGCCVWPEYDYYRPGKWIPHCTLAMEFEDALLPRALDIAFHLKLPLNGTIVGVGVIALKGAGEFRPVKHLFAFNLGEK